VTLVAFHQKNKKRKIHLENKIGWSKEKYYKVEFITGSIKHRIPGSISAGSLFEAVL